MRAVKAAVMPRFGSIEVREFPYPSRVPDDALIVKMRMSGVCGTDKHLFDGRNPALPLPIILGHENLGTVHEVGQKARQSMEVHGKELRPGTRVTWFPAVPCGTCWYCRWLPHNHPGFLCENAPAFGLNLSCSDPPHLLGGFAEYAYIMPGTWVYAIPDELPDDVAVLTDVFASVGGVIKALGGYPAVKEGFSPGDMVVVQGAGAMGIAAGIVSRLCGAQSVVLIGAPTKRLEIAGELGVFDALIDISRTPHPEDRIRQVRALSPGGVGADLVVDCTGVAEAVPEGLEMVRRAGVFVEIGSFVETGSVSISPFRHICLKDVHIVGQFGGAPHSYEYGIKFLLLAYKRGYPISKLVTHRFALAETEEALRRLKALDCLKAVVVHKDS